MTNALTLGTSEIRQLEGLYSLNDLHKASGGKPHHQPAKFTCLEQTKALIAEIENSPKSESLETAGIPAIKSIAGRNGGTYACRELVIAYAAWISPAFHLKVIRVFLDAVAPQPSEAHSSPTNAFAETSQALITEVDDLKNRLAAQETALHALARDLDIARRGHIDALTQLSQVQDAQLKEMVAREKHQAHNTILTLTAEGMSHETIRLVTGRSINHIRAVISQDSQDKRDDDGGHDDDGSASHVTNTLTIGTFPIRYHEGLLRVLPNI